MKPIWTVLNKMIAVTLLTVGITSHAQAQTKVLIISDVDDTIKVSHILDLTEKVARAADYTTPFAGMAQLYQLLINMDPSHTKVVYLSNAPEKILGVAAIQFSHQRFLDKNNFPKGDLILRTDIPVSQHKLVKIRELIDREMPEEVILTGDNGEADVDVYHQLVGEYKNVGIKITTFIHLLYSSKVPFYVPHILAEQGRVPYSEQFGYVTPIEIALQLKDENILNQQSVDWLIKNVSPYIVNESIFKLDGGKPLTFPNFSSCSDFHWRWAQTPELAPLINKLSSKCN